MTDTLKTFTLEHIAGQKCSHKSAELRLYLVRLVNPGVSQLDVQED
jgi:hypothetical protein